MQISDRNRQIVDMVSKGYTMESIADTMGLSKARISQINQEWREEISDDGTRERDLAQLDYVTHEVLYPMLQGPGRRLVSPSGRPVYEMSEFTDEKGNSLPDYGKPLYDEFAKIDAVNALVRVQERRARVLGLDRVKPKELDQSEEIKQALEYSRRLIEENQELRHQVTTLQAQAVMQPALDVHEAEVVED